MATDLEELCEPFGPEYNVNSQQLGKFRRWAKEQGNVMALDRVDRVAYANAVEQAVLASQRASLAPQREVVFKAGCASGTFHSDGADIIKAVLQQQRSALAAYPAQARKARTPRQWQEMYDEAMREKRKRRKS